MGNDQDMITHENIPVDDGDEEVTSAEILKLVKKKYMKALKSDTAPSDEMIKILKDASKLAMDEKRLTQEAQNAVDDRELARQIARLDIAPRGPNAVPGAVIPAEDRFADVALPELVTVPGEMGMELEDLRFNPDSMKK